MTYYKLQQILLQIAIGCFIINCDKMLLQIATANLLQIATSLLQIATVLQIATILLQIATAITNCDNYYKLRQNILCVFN